MSSFTPGSALIGGAIIGLAAAVLLLGSNRVAGISSLLAGFVSPRDRERGGTRGAFLSGFVAASLGVGLLARDLVGPAVAPLALLAGAGLLVGYGTRTGGGCTSGHGLCGIPAGRRRSVVATATFMAAGAATVFVSRHVLGVAP